MAARKWRTFQRTERILVFTVNEGNSYEVIDSSGSTQILIPGDVLVDLPSTRRTMRLLDFIEMALKMGWKMAGPRGPCVEWGREQVRRFSPSDPDDPSVVELEIDGKLTTTEDGSRTKNFALAGVLEELRREGFVEAYEVQ